MMEDANETRELTRVENLVKKVMQGVFLSIYLWNRLVIAILSIATILGILYLYG